MKKLQRMLLAVLLAATMLLSSGCASLFDDFLRDTGVPEEQIGQLGDAYDQVKDKLEEGVDHLGGKLDTLTDRLEELIANSDDAYKAVTGIYASTRLPNHYESLNGKAMDGVTFWNAPYEEGKASRLCRFEDLLGNLKACYKSVSAADGKNPFSQGQCTWYAYGRFLEDNRIALGTAMGNAVQWLDDVDDWVRNVYHQENPDTDMGTYANIDGYLSAGVFISRGAEKIYPHSIAVCTSSQSAGHVVYIEDVLYTDGVPTMVYFSEANWKGTSGQLDDWDGVLQSMPYSTFLQKRSVLGYIVPLNLYI